MRRSLVYPITAAALTIGLLGPQAAPASIGGDPQTELGQVRAQRAQAASEINTSKASLADIDNALQALDTNVRTQEELLGQAEQAEADATQQATDAEAAVRRITDERTLLHKLVANRAVAAFVDPPVDDLLTMLQTRDITLANDRKVLVELRAQSDADLADRLRGLNRDLDFERSRAVEAKALAAHKHDEQRARTRVVERAKAAKQRVADGIQRRIDTNVARSVALARTDKALSTQIALEQAALQARLAAARAAVRPRPTTIRPNGTESGPIGSVPASGGSGGLSLTTVGGITVASQIAGQLGAMLGAARASGLTLTGSGYRDPAQQIALRQAHCGSSYYAVYQMSPGSCSPPTARPGTSMHEVGLAIDFDSCSSHGTACWQWLNQNASRFGFFNLPSEPWHWSINGN